MTTHEIFALLTAVAVIAFGLGYLCRDWEQWAKDRHTLTDIADQVGGDAS